jgi:alpha-tubulin suppressor-like RCC1 family protein
MIVKRRFGAWHAFVAAAIVMASLGTASVAAQARSQGPNTPSGPSGSVARWGDYFGGRHSDFRTPHVVSGLANVVAIDASNSSNYALECAGGVSSCPTDGIVMAWGDGAVGQLGDGSNHSPHNQPVQVHFPSGVNIVSIGEARDEGFAIDSTGQGWGWGLNGHGSLCIGNTTKQSVPVAIPGLTSVTAVQGGQDHVLWLLANGTVMACGANNYGQLGTGRTRASNVPTAVRQLTDIVQITAGNTTSGALDSSGNVYMWGYNRRGQVGIGSGDQGSISTPTKVTLPLPAVQLSSGGDIIGNGHSLAILNDGSVYAWGDDANGQLGDGQTFDKFSPVQVTVPAGVTFTNVAAGGCFSLALDTNGYVYSWGCGQRGQLGVAGMSQSTSPIEVDSGVGMISATANNALDFHS